MAWSFDLVTAPVLQFDAATPGLVQERKMIGQVGYAKVPLGQTFPFIPEWSLRPQDDIVTILDGPDRSFFRKRHAMQLRINVDSWGPTQWDALNKMLQSERLVQFCPPYDYATAWSSDFNNQDPGAGLAVVGDNEASTYVGRAVDASEYHRSYDQDLARLTTILDTGTMIAKLVPGMVGKAILLHRRSEQLVTQSVWTANGGAVVVSGGESNSNQTGGQLCFMDGSGSHFLSNTNMNTATNGERYTAWVDVCGSGQVLLRVLHNSGGTTVNSAVKTLDGTWQRVEVSWTQVGTSVELRMLQNSSISAYFHSATQQVQRAHRSGSNLSPIALLALPDALRVTNPVHTGRGFTISLWYYKTTGSAVSDSVFFASWKQVGSNDGYFGARTDENSQAWRYHVRFGHNSTEHTWNSTAAVDTWVHLVLRVDAASGGLRSQVYENGALLGSNVLALPDHLPLLSQLWIGSDSGQDSPSGFGLDVPLDSFRVDQRAWSAAEILTEYEMKSDASIRALLAMTSGRLFRIAGVPKGFRGPFQAEFVGDLLLEEVSHNPAGLL